MTGSVFAPRLPSYIESVMPARMSDLLRMAVDAHSRRDSNLVEGYDQLMRITPPNPNRPDRESSDLVDPLCFGLFLSTLSTVRAARSQRPYWLFEAVDPGDDEAAQRVERGLTIRVDRDGFAAALYDADWISLRDGIAPMYIGWSTKRKIIREIRYLAEGMEAITENLITADEREPGIEYKEVPYARPAVHKSGLEFEVADLANFYMMAPGANDVEESMGCGTRRYWSANQLMEGIYRYGFEEDAVKEIIKLGPTGYGKDGQYVESKRDVSGTGESQVQPESDGVGLWELFRWFGQFPIWTRNGGMEVPDHLRDDEFLWIICPKYEKILRFSYSPYEMRPYTQFRVLREPNGQGGESFPSMTGAHQEEATAWVRMAIDSAAFRSIPVLKRLASNDERFGTQVLTPGGTVFCERSLNEIDTLRWDHAQLGEMEAILNDCRQRAQSTVSGAGYGELPSKVRKSDEVKAAVAGVSSKMQLYTQNLQNTGMERAALICLSHLGQFETDPYTATQRGQKAVEINPDDWKKVYSIRPRASAADADPGTRIERKRMVTEVVRSSPIYQMKIQAGDMEIEYHLLRDIVAAIDETGSLESYIGEEPPPPDHLQVVAQMMGQVYAQMVGPLGNAKPEQVAQQAAQNFMRQPAMIAIMSKMLQGQRGEHAVGGEPAMPGMPHVPELSQMPGANFARNGVAG